jgi:hypothetical protein
MNDYEIVRLKVPISGSQVPVGARGVILMVFDSPERGYEVEFFDSEGESLENFTVTEDQIEPWSEEH